MHDGETCQRGPQCFFSLDDDGMTQPTAGCTALTSVLFVLLGHEDWSKQLALHKRDSHAGPGHVINPLLHITVEFVGTRVI